MRHFLLIVLIFVSGILSAGEESVEKLQWLKKANPVEDANNALKNGDSRLRAIYGFVLFIPGKKYEEFSELENKYGINPIEGTSDSLSGSEHKKLNDLAIEYAKKYNEVIFNQGAK